MQPDRMETLEVVGIRPKVNGVRLGHIVGISRDGRAIVDYPGNPYGPLMAQRTASVSPETIETAHREQQAVLLTFQDQDPGIPIVFDVMAKERSTRTSTTESDARVERRSDESAPFVAEAGNPARIARIVAVRDRHVMIDFEGNPDGPRPAKTTVPLRNLKNDVLVVLAGETLVIVGQLYQDVPLAHDGGDGCEVALRGKSIRIEAEDEIVIAAGASQVHLDARGKAVTTADQVVSRARGVNKVQGGSVKLN